jgi:hypothetical protein
VPYYDASIVKEKKNLLGEVQMSHLIKAKVEGLKLKTMAANEGDSSDSRIIN